MLPGISPLKWVAAGWAAVSVLLLALGTAGPADPSPKEALSSAISPVQKDVSYAKVQASEIKDCRVESKKEKDWAGWYVLGPAGDRLRRFADTNDDKQIDMWCYYEGGIEVYRDIDSDFNGKADQYRWLGTAGSRWGIDKDEDGKIDSWKRISAQEVTQEIVRAVATGDTARYSTLLLTDREAVRLNIADEQASKLKQKLSDAARSFRTFASKQDALNSKSNWAHFVASQPGAITDAVSSNANDDVIVYENVVAMYDNGDGTSGQLAVGTLVKIGDTWRVIDVPQIVGVDDAIAQTTGFFFTTPSASSSQVAASAKINANTQKLVADLESIEKQLTSAASVSAKTRLHESQAKVLVSLISSSRDANETMMWIRQMTETVSAAIHGGEYPAGLVRLDRLRRSIPAKNKKLAAYVNFEYINADYGLKLQQKNADFPKIQEAKIKALTDFVNEYPDAEESAKAMMDLALSKEFENEDKAAVVWYRKVISNFPQSPEAKKAQGAIRRLDAIGNTLPLRGTTIEGRAFDLRKYRGRPVVIHYWATWCESCKQDMKLFRKLQAKYAKENLELVGINVDTRRDDAQKYLRDNASTVNWPQLFADGGLESSPLANILGVQTLPTTLVIDKDGKIAQTNVVATELEDEIRRVVR